MRRYFFDLRDENGVVTDDEGIQLSTLEAVQDEAAHALSLETRRAGLIRMTVSCANWKSRCVMTMAR
jgi:hypothetical protein